MNDNTGLTESWRMRFSLAMLALLWTGCWGGVAAETGGADMPAYQAAVQVEGEIRLSGSPDDRLLLEALQRGFEEHHPGIRFAARLYGPESTIAAVYTGVADIAFMAREIREPMERMAFEWAKLARPVSVEIANAGFAADRPAHQLAVYVHPDNPLKALSLPVLEAIYSAEPVRGVRPLQSWGDLGLIGDLNQHQIMVMGPELDSIAALFFRRTVMPDSHKWNPVYREYACTDAMLQMLRKEPAGIAIAPLLSRHPGLRVLALSEHEGGEYHLPNRENIIAGTYPLTRVVSVVIHRPPGETIPPRIAEFLRFILSTDGQAIIERNSSYLPLSREMVARQLQRLGP